MRILKVVSIFAAAIAPQVVSAHADRNDAAPPSTMDVQHNSENGYRMTLKSYRSSTVAAGQAELLPKAAQLCAPRSAQLGRYSFDMTEPIAGGNEQPAVLVLRQEIECGAAPSVEPSRGAQIHPAPRMATPEQVRSVEQQTRRYFEAKDQGRYTGAYDLMAASMKQSMSFATWKGRVEAFNAAAGTVKQRTISKITWYHNPPQVEPGLYAAVDFTSKFAEVDLHCGFLAWHEQPDGKFVLVREEENYLDRQTRQKLNPDDVEKIRQQFGCT